MNGNPRVLSAGSILDIMNSTGLTAAKTTVAADVATLVADGASPTQAHVTTLNTDWGTLSPLIAGPGVTNGDVILSFDGANVTTKNQLRAAVAALLAILDGSSVLT